MTFACNSTLAASLALALLAAPAPSQQPAHRPSQDPSTTRASFVANHGQWPAAVQFRYAQGPAVAWLHTDGLTLTLVHSSPTRSDQHAPGWGMQPGTRRQTTLRLSFEAAAHSMPRGEDRQRAVHNYYLGNDANGWASAVPTFARVVQPDIAPGIDAVWQQRDGLLAYDLHVTGGADEAAAVTHIDGAQSLRVEPNGSLRVSTEFGDITLTAPRCWEVRGDDRLPVDSRIVLVDDQHYRIACDRIDPDLPLVIDPGLEWSTFLGGSVDEAGFAIRTDADDRLYVTGSTNSPNFPATNTLGGGNDVFVTCIDPSLPGNQTVWSTLIGGGSDDVGFDLDVTAGGIVTVVGLTNSSNFPTTANAFAPKRPGGAYDGFIAQLTPAGTVSYGSYYGGSAADRMCAIEPHPAGGFAIGGYSGSTNLPTTAGVYQSGNSGRWDAFVVRFDPSLSDAAQNIAATYLGGPGFEGYWAPYSAPDNKWIDLAVADTGTITIVVAAEAGFPTTPNAPFPNYLGGVADVAVSQLDSTLSTLSYSTFLGTASEDAPWSVALGAGGDVVVAGFAKGPGLATTPGAMQPNYGGGAFDGMIAVLRPALGATSVIYSTYNGGPNSETMFEASVEPSGVITVSGANLAGSFPTTPWGLLPNHPGSTNTGVITRLEPAGNGSADRHYSSYLGPDNEPYAHVQRADGRVALTGIALPNFPIVGPAPQPSYGGGARDAFVALVDLLPSNVTRVGVGSGACTSMDMQINTMPAAGASLELICNDALAPAGFLVIGLQWSPYPFLGIDLLVQPIIQVQANTVGGSCRVQINVPPIMSPPFGLGFQYLFLANGSCPNPGPLAASDSLRF